MLKEDKLPDWIEILQKTMEEEEIVVFEDKL